MRLYIDFIHILGMSKMLINQHDKLSVTSDAATIIKELDVIHPAAKMLVMASQMQEAVRIQNIFSCFFPPKFYEIFRTVVMEPISWLFSVVSFCHKLVG